MCYIIQMIYGGDVMSLKHAILGFLNYKPRTGYELQKKLNRTISHFWPTTQSQVYRTLNEMLENELIVSEFIVQSDKPNKKIYSITPKGAQELKEWLSHPITLPKYRNPYFVQLFFSKYVKQGVIIQNMLNYQKQQQKTLDFLKGDEVSDMVKIYESDIEEALYKIIRNHATSNLECEINCIKNSIKIISEVNENDGGKDL